MDGIENARIKNICVGYEYGSLTVSISTEGDCWLQSFGDFSLGSQFRWTEHVNWSAWFICSVFDTVGVHTLEDLIDEPIRIRREEGRIVAIGHFLKDVWFCPREVIDFMEI